MDDLLNDVANAIAAFPDTSMTVNNLIEADATVNSENYKVEIDDFDEDDPIGDEEMGVYKMPKKVKDHTEILDVVLAVLSLPKYRVNVRGLTTDGDHHDCEAIFKYNGNPTIIKVH